MCALNSFAAFWNFFAFCLNFISTLILFLLWQNKNEKRKKKKTFSVACRANLTHKKQQRNRKPRQKGRRKRERGRNVQQADDLQHK